MTSNLEKEIDKLLTEHIDTSVIKREFDGKIMEVKIDGIDEYIKAITTLFEQIMLEIIGKDEVDNRWDGQWRNGFNSAKAEQRANLNKLMKGGGK